MSSPVQPPYSSSTLAGDRITIDTPEQITLEFPLAGIGSRFMAIALDTVIQFIIYLAGIFALVGLERFSPEFPLWFRWIPEAWAPALIILLFFCIYWGYFAFFEVIWKGKTPGKRLAGIRAIKESGRALNVYEVIGRNLVRAVDAFPGLYLVGIVSVFISRQNQRLGDLLVGSIVVHDKAPEQVRIDWSTTNVNASASEALPELNQISSEELILIETYLQRRDSFDFATRDTTAHKIASRITAKTGIQRDTSQSLDEFLERIARQLRDSAKLRPSTTKNE
ncbi:MAG TPA: RDD family protein [Candidatus Binatia bacterium]|nr:RDD family protein [Candidatus Binatia bacterium]